MTAPADVVVIGGGIVGAACVYHLSRAGARVRVVERDFAASGTSRACDGPILFSDKASPAELALAQASADLWAELAETLEADFEYAVTGTLVLYETEEGLATGQRKAAQLQPAGVRAEIVDAAGLRGLEPNLAHDLAAACSGLPGRGAGGCPGCDTGDAGRGAETWGRHCRQGRRLPASGWAQRDGLSL